MVRGQKVQARAKNCRFECFNYKLIPTMNNIDASRHLEDLLLWVFAAQSVFKMPAAKKIGIKSGLTNDRNLHS